MLNKRGILNRTREINALLQEMDKIWLNIQGKDKPKKRKFKKKKLKLGIIYEGWKKRKRQ